VRAGLPFDPQYDQSIAKGREIDTRDGIHQWAEEGFGRGAAAYERGRPSYPPAAVAYLVARLDLRVGVTVVDLAAGTGKLACLLVPSGARVLAVEPVDAMRELIPRDGIEVLAGTAEAIPLPAAAADTVVVAQALQWFDADTALAEIHRVLRRRGSVAIMRNRRDLADPVQRAFEDILGRHRSHPSLEADLDIESSLRDTGLFEVRELREFAHEHELEAGDIVPLAASETSIAILDGDVRAAALAEFGRLADSLPTPLRLRYTTEICLGDRVDEGDLAGH
jgi:SAM-dependent methyltransferase